MTVDELIQELQQFDGDMEVEFAYDYGDYAGRVVAHKISDVDIEEVKYSDYTRTDVVVFNDNNDDDDDDDSRRYTVVLS